MLHLVIAMAVAAAYPWLWAAVVARWMVGR